MQPPVVQLCPLPLRRTFSTPSPPTTSTRTPSNNSGTFTTPRTPSSIFRQSTSSLLRRRSFSRAPPTAASTSHLPPPPQHRPVPAPPPAYHATPPLLDLPHPTSSRFRKLKHKQLQTSYCLLYATYAAHHSETNPMAQRYENMCRELAWFRNELGVAKEMYAVLERRYADVKKEMEKEAEEVVTGLVERVSELEVRLMESGGKEQDEKGGRKEEEKAGGTEVEDGERGVSLDALDGVERGEEVTDGSDAGGAVFLGHVDVDSESASSTTAAESDSDSDRKNIEVVDE